VDQVHGPRVARTTTQTSPTGGSTSRAGRTRKGTDRLKQHNTAPGWGGSGR